MSPMDSSLIVQLQQNPWLHTQLVKRLSSSVPSSSSSSISSSSSSAPPHEQAPSWPPTDLRSPSFSADSPSWQSELAGLSDAWDDGSLTTTSFSSSSSSLSPSSSDSSSWGASSPYRGPSSASSDPWMPGNQLAQVTVASSVAGPSLDATVAVETASFLDDVLMDPVLEFISDILMGENMEDRKCMKHECLSYQAMVNGVTGKEASVRSSHCPGMGRRKSADTFTMEAGTGASVEHGLEAEDYRWIENVLVANPLSEGSFARGEAWSPENVMNGDHVVNKMQQDQTWGTWPQLPLHEASSISSSVQGSQVVSFDYSFSSNHFSEDFSSGKLEKSFNAVYFPVENHTYTAPSLPSIPSVQDSVSFGDVLPFGDGQGIQNNAFLLDLKQAQPAGASVEKPLSFVKNEYLKAEKHAKMYGDWWPEQGALAAKKKQSRHGNGKKSGKAEPVDLRSLLVDCAQAVGANNLRKANEIVLELRQHASPHGSAAQRLAHYFTEGLVARLTGIGAQQYTEMSINRPSAADMLKAFRVIVEVCPYPKMAHFFANQNILKVAEGASRLHIVDYGILYGVQWPALISALAERRGGPPFLRITGIEFPQPGVNPAERVEETGRRLAEYAKAYNVPFEYQAIAKKWEDIEPADLHLREGEILAVNCVQRLRHLMDETVVSASPRNKVLSIMHSFKPDIVLIAILNAGFNAPFFVSRFREALYHYSSKFDMIETTLADAESPQRHMLERECVGRDILNIVACEGHERVERPETYRQWQGRFQRAGFVPLTLDHSVVKKARDVVKAFYHNDFSVDDDSKWMLLGWKGRIMEGLSAWKCSSP